MSSQVTNKTIQEFVNRVSDQHYPLSGAVIAASAAQAAALGEACMQISFDNQVDTLDWQDVSARIEQMLYLKQALLAWADQNAKAIVVYHQTGSGQIDPQAIYEGSAEIARLTITALEILRNFRPLTLENLVESLDVTIHLLWGAANAALCLLDNNLNHQPASKVKAEYGLLINKLRGQLNQITLT